MLRVLNWTAICFFSSIALASGDVDDVSQADIEGALETARKGLQGADRAELSAEVQSELDDQRSALEQVTSEQKRDHYFQGLTREHERADSAPMTSIEGHGRNLLSQEGEGARPETIRPVLLVSFSIPEASLDALLSDASDAGAVVAIRGLIEEDWGTTIKTLRRLADENGLEGGVAIDPTLFRRFDITTVPAHILPLEPIEPCTNDGCPEVRHVKASGSVTTTYFLETVSRLGSPQEKQSAEELLSYKD